MRKAREKFRVAREERKSPRRRREKDFVRWYCCVVGAKLWLRNSEMRGGKTIDMAWKRQKTKKRPWIC